MNMENINSQKKVVTQEDLVKEARKRSGMSDRDIRNAFRTILKVISKNIDEGNVVAITDFGKFEVATTRERKQNFFGKGTITVPEHEVVRFKAYKGLRSYFMK